MRKCLNYGGRLSSGEVGKVKLGGLDANEEMIGDIYHLIISACGTSYHSALYGKELLREFGCLQSVEVKISSEVETADFPQKSFEKIGFLSVS